MINLGQFMYHTINMQFRAIFKMNPQLKLILTKQSKAFTCAHLNTLVFSMEKAFAGSDVISPTHLAAAAVLVARAEQNINHNA